MTSSACLRYALALATLAMAGSAFAIQTCELDGQYINPDNGASTAGKSGLMRCLDKDTGVVMREQELRNGKYVGVVRYFKKGQLEREFSVDERGNRSGLSREWNIGADGQRVLVREETQSEGHAVGVVRTWYTTGEKRRISFQGDDKREQAVVEFNPDGRLSDLRCGARPVFSSEFDDKTACGHAGKTSTVMLYDSKGVATSRVSFERGERRKIETLWENGAVRELRETSDAGVLERRFAADGTKLREAQWVNVAARDPQAPNARPRSIKVLEQEFHASGKLVQEKRWKPVGDIALLASENLWYLNGQPKERVEYEYTDGDEKKLTRRAARYHDNGKLAFEGGWRSAPEGSRSYRSELPVGTHKSFDDQGRVRGESIYDERGRISREREFDESGAVVRDDEVFEDGSRKSMAR